jgi:excisionase family DNA binding protein
MLSISKRLLYRMVQRGEINSLKVSTRRLFCHSDLMEFVASHRVSDR